MRFWNYGEVHDSSSFSTDSVVQEFHYHRGTCEAHLDVRLSFDFRLFQSHQHFLHPENVIFDLSKGIGELYVGLSTFV